MQPRIAWGTCPISASSKFSACRQQQRSSTRTSSSTITIEERKRFLEARGRDFEENFVLDRSFLLPHNRSEVPQSYSYSYSSSSSSSILLGRSDPRSPYHSPLGLSENVNRKSSGSAQQALMAARPHRKCRTLGGSSLESNQRFQGCGERACQGGGLITAAVSHDLCGLLRGECRMIHSNPQPRPS